MPIKVPVMLFALMSASGSTAGPVTANTGAISSPRIPDTAVYDQNGKRLRFYTDLIKGKTVAINFIFTTCTTICPPLTAMFRKLQQDLGERIGLEVRLISVSVDPATDTPERLRDFAAKFNAGPGWTFVTGNKAEIDSLLQALGAAVGDKNDHTPMILVGNDVAGYWTRAYGLTPPATLVKLITEATNRE
ncbi:MAG: SCO family protein [Chromatiales bacterium]